jgi:glutathione peroxidase
MPSQLPPIYQVEAVRIDGTVQTLAAFRGQVLLVVNVASQCGFTPQYAGLEALYRKHHDQGFSILGFPCDQFGHQEPGTEEEILEFCTTSYNVTFPMFRKIAVNGPDTHPLYRLLKAEQAGVLGTESIKWNFTKFLVSRSGQVVRRYAPADTPANLEGDVAVQLAAPR